MLDDYRVFSFNFVDENKKEALYWRDVGTLEAYYEANMDLVSVSPVFNLYDDTGRSALTSASIHRQNSCLPSPARMGHALDSLVSAGCIISGGYGEELRALSQTCALIPSPKSRTAFCSRT